ncbi:unnamed protein product [Effrenium voratum]|uniref:Uncharacterized protein n=1 Tax=Effrenium voratum TaxID=2562239 RepID=A0AA36NJ91_9DINO|nr:unnamed protein product [Effrenium voratum]CAJ1443267.1 unnamed protein product [Effrenium voratum]
MSMESLSWLPPDQRGEIVSRPWSPEDYGAVELRNAAARGALRLETACGQMVSEVRFSPEGCELRGRPRGNGAAGPASSFAEGWETPAGDFPGCFSLRWCWEEFDECWLLWAELGTAETLVLECMEESWNHLRLVTWTTSGPPHLEVDLLPRPLANPNQDLQVSLLSFQIECLKLEAEPQFRQQCDALQQLLQHITQPKPEPPPPQQPQPQQEPDVEIPPKTRPEKPGDSDSLQQLLAQIEQEKPQELMELTPPPEVRPLEKPEKPVRQRAQRKPQLPQAFVPGAPGLIAQPPALLKMQPMAPDMGLWQAPTYAEGMGWYGLCPAAAHEAWLQAQARALAPAPAPPKPPKPPPEPAQPEEEVDRPLGKVRCFLPNAALPGADGHLLRVQSLKCGDRVRLWGGKESEVLDVKHTKSKKKPHDLVDLSTHQGAFTVSKAQRVTVPDPKGPHDQGVGSLKSGDLVIVGNKERALTKVSTRKERTDIYEVILDADGPLETFQVPSWGILTLGCQMD